MDKPDSKTPTRLFTGNTAMPIPVTRHARRRAQSSRQLKRNDPCPCGSGKKYKKCHGKPYQPPQQLSPAAMPAGAITEAIVAPRDDPRETTADTLKNMGVMPREVWAYQQTGILVTDTTRESYTEEEIAKYEAALAEYDETIKNKG